MELHRIRLVDTVMLEHGLSLVVHHWDLSAQNALLEHGQLSKELRSWIPAGIALLVRGPPFLDSTPVVAAFSVNLVNGHPLRLLLLRLIANFARLEHGHQSLELQLLMHALTAMKVHGHPTPGKFHLLPA